MIIQNLSLSFGLQVIFKDITLNIKDNEHVGIIGDNGAGKSTFFKVILGELTPDFGKIIIPSNSRIGFLPQIIDEEIPNKDISVYDYLLTGRPIEKLNIELEDLYIKASESNNENEQNKLLKRIGNVQMELDYYEQYDAENILMKILFGMNFNDELLGMSLHNLSGGQKSKVAFARLLYSKPEIILLDEPTNHLDKESKEFVTNYLKEYHGSVYVISHDIEFLNMVTNKTLFLDKRTQTMELYNGNYDYFIKVSKAREESIINQMNIQAREEKKLRDIVLLYSNSSGKRKRMAQDREKKLAKLEENKITILDESKRAIVNVNQNRESGMIPLKVDNLCFHYKENTPYLINNLSFELLKGEKFLIVGRNGIGKSTLLKLIMGILSPNEGTIEHGFKTDIGYYAQEHELLDNEKTVIDNFSDMGVPIKQLRATLGNFLFSGDNVYKMVKILSPGERSRVALAKLSLTGANFLVLDEPTNHLDPKTQEIIAHTFNTFKGTMLVVSHNTSFVKSLGISRTLDLETGKIDYYDNDIVSYYETINNKDKR